jgi:hypothetical protein
MTRVSNIKTFSKAPIISSGRYIPSQMHAQVMKRASLLIVIHKNLAFFHKKTKFKEENPEK